MAELIKTAVLKRKLKEAGFNSTKGFPDLLEEKVMTLVEDAAKRCSANNRKTISEKDL